MKLKHKLMILGFVFAVILSGCTNNEVDRCENQANGAERDRCYWEEATRQQKIELCSEISEYFWKMKEVCELDVHSGKTKPSG